jgi:uncharacterized glyoxalase superfamily protein PhnB
MQLSFFYTDFKSGVILFILRKLRSMNIPFKVNLGYRDAASAINFLVDVLGFEKVLIYPGTTENTIAHAELHWPGGGVVTLHSSEPDKNSVADLAQLASRDGGYPAFSIHVDTHDPEAVFERVVRAGAVVIRELKTSPMGKGFIVSDPEGLYWSFGTPLPKLVRNEQGRWLPEE